MQQRYKQNTNSGNAQADPQLVNTVAAVIQALQADRNPTEQGFGKPQTSSAAPKTVDPIGLLFYVLEKFWIVLLAAIACAALFGGIAFWSVPTYTATAKLYIANSPDAILDMQDLQMGSALAMDYQEVFKTWEVHEMVRTELDLPYSYEQMQSMMSITNPEDTRVLYITVSHTDARMAADIANAYVKAAREFIITYMHSEIPRDFSMAMVPGVAQNAGRIGALVKGFLLGGMLAIGGLTLLFILDDRPLTPEGVRAYGGIPILTVLPRVKARKQGYGNSSRRKKQR